MLANLHTCMIRKHWLLKICNFHLFRAKINQSIVCHIAWHNIIEALRLRLRNGDSITAPVTWKYNKTLLIIMESHAACHSQLYVYLLCFIAIWSSSGGTIPLFCCGIKHDLHTLPIVQSSILSSCTPLSHISGLVTIHTHLIHVGRAWFARSPPTSGCFTFACIVVFVVVVVTCKHVCLHFNQRG